MLKADIESSGKNAELETSDPSSGAVKDGASSTPHPSAVAQLRIGLVVLVMFTVIGFAVFIAHYVVMSTASGVLYTYSCPATTMWMGLGCFWLCSMQLLWWTIFRDYTRGAHVLWLVCNAFFAVMGFICLVSYAASKSEGSASGASLLWIFSGIAGALIAFRWIQEFKKRCSQPGEPTKTCTQSCYTCLCSWKSWFLGFGCLILAFFFVLTIGVMIQSAWAASDYSKFAPLGSIYKIQVRGVDLQMHLYCQGPLASAKPTMIFEHGGGANSLSMKALADHFAPTRRSCIYDRLGYGWTPSLYTVNDARDFATSGEILTALLAAAGEAGPYVCVGHSAGAQACINFALAAPAGSVTGIVGLDGYPDLIRAGSLRPGRQSDTSNAILSSILLFTVLAGPTGITRNLVGNAGPDFVPADARDANSALYAQSRFWVSQYWDAKGDINSGSAGYLYPKLNGTFDASTRLFTYGRSLRGLKAVWIPAFATVNTTCSDTVKYNDYCCGTGAGGAICNDRASDSAVYLAQANLYAATLGELPGKVYIMPPGSEHTFPYSNKYYQSAAAWMAAEFP